MSGQGNNVGVGREYRDRERNVWVGTECRDRERMWWMLMCMRVLLSFKVILVVKVRLTRARTYTHTQIHTHAHTHARTHTHTHTHTHREILFESTYEHAVCVYVWAFVCLCVRACVSACVRACVRVCVFVRVREREGGRERETHKTTTRTESQVLFSYFCLNVLFHKSSLFPISASGFCQTSFFQPIFPFPILSFIHSVFSSSILYLLLPSFLQLYKFIKSISYSNKTNA